MCAILFSICMLYMPLYFQEYVSPLVSCIENLKFTSEFKIIPFLFSYIILQIIMEYCGAGSVSDLMKIRNKTVGAFQFGIIIICISDKQVLFLTVFFSFPSPPPHSFRGFELTLYKFSVQQFYIPHHRYLQTLCKKACPYFDRTQTWIK